MRVLLIASFLVGSGSLSVRTNTTYDTAQGKGAADQVMHVKALVNGGPCLGGWNAINPSFSAIPDSSDLAVAMRGLCMQKHGPHASWYSKTVIGRIPAYDIRGSREFFHWKSLHVAPDLRRVGGSRQECHVPGCDIAKGTEDPRVVKTKAGLFAIATGYDVMKSSVGKSPVCGKNAVMLYAAKVKSLSPPQFGSPVQLTFSGMNSVEKNWAMFTPWALDGADVLAVYSIYPHRIAKVNLQHGDVNFIAHSESESLRKLAHQLGVEPHDFHGGAGVAHAWYNGQHFLSVLHAAVHHKDGSKEYWNFPYKFAHKHPYEILHIGKRLPLKLKRNPAYGEMVAFVTTVMVDNNDVFIGYGSGDRSSRTFRMSQREFETKFFSHTSLDQIEGDLAEDVDAADLGLLARPSRFNSSSAISIRTQMGCQDELTPTICRINHE